MHEESQRLTQSATELRFPIMCVSEEKKSIENTVDSLAAKKTLKFLGKI